MYIADITNVHYCVEIWNYSSIEYQTISLCLFAVKDAFYHLAI